MDWTWVNSMGTTYSSISSMKKAIRQKAKQALEETIEKSFQDAHENVDNFYNSPMGTYQRTGQLAESVEREIYQDGNAIGGEIRLDTSYRYNPSGRDTQTIYGYAESGGLLGDGGFWERTVKDVEKNIDESFGKRFKR